MLDVEKQINYWKETALSNIGTAELLIRERHHIEGLFFCHLFIEKILKAHVVKVTKQLPPKTHNLIWLLTKINLNIPKEFKNLPATLMLYQLEGRYPENYPTMPSEKEVTALLTQSKTFFQWLEKQL